MEDAPNAELIATDPTKDPLSIEVNAPPSSIVDNVPSPPHYK